MKMAKRIGGKAAKIALAAVGAAALSAVGTGVVQFCKWAKDPYSTELWFGFLKKGILITKTDEPGHFKVQTGYRWHDDEAFDGEESFDEPEMEITLPEETPEPVQDEQGPETIAEAIHKAAEKVEAVKEAVDGLVTEKDTAPEAENEA